MNFFKTKPKTTIIVSFFLLTLLCIIIEGIHTSQNEILEDSIYLKEIKKDSFFQQAISFCKKIIRFDFGKQTFSFAKPSPSASPDTLSYFLLFKLNRRAENEHELNFKYSGIPDAAKKDFVERNLTLVTLNDITEQAWKWEGDNFSGSFSFKTPYNANGKCLFEGKNNTIKKMVIAKKGSSRFEDGYAVFGCTYGRSYFDDNNYFNSRLLPENEAGETITYDKFNKHSLAITLLLYGGIYVKEDEITEKELHEMLKKAKQEKNNTPPIAVYVKFDTNLPKDRKEKVIELIKKYDIPLYRLFLSSKDYTIMAKKIE